MRVLLYIRIRIMYNKSLYLVYFTGGNKIIKDRHHTLEKFLNIWRNTRMLESASGCSHIEIVVAIH